jgi:hypothetical protein
MTAAYGTGGLGRTTTATPALSFTLAAGTGVMVAIEWDASATFTSIVSTLGNTYTLVGAEITAFGMKTRVYRSVTTVTGSETVTITLSGSVVSVRTYDIATGIDAANDSGTPSVDAASPWTGTNVTPATADNVVMSVCVNNSVNAATTFTAGNSYTKTQEETDASSFWPLATGYRITASASAIGGSWTASQGSSAYVWNVAFTSAGAGSPATISSATPSGTLGTSTSATLGATTDQTSGTLYGVVDVAASITGITVAQVKAGQNNAGAAPVASGNSTVSTTSPSIGVSGLTANTLYSYAVAQNNTNGDSNVLTGTFTTATAAVNGIRDYGPRGALKTLLTM